MSYFVREYIACPNKSLNYTFRYIDDVLSMNNPTFSDHLDQI